MNRDPASGNSQAGDDRIPGPPRAVIIGAGLLAAATLALGVLAGQTGIGRLSGPAAAAGPELRLSLRFEDQADGSVLIRSAETRDVVGELPPGGGNFERGALRALVRQRKLQGLDGPPTFELSDLGAGRLVLSDPLTGTRIDLAAFGPTNLGAFARLLPAQNRHAEARGSDGPVAVTRRESR